MGIRPALETLVELDNGNFMDKLAVAIHDAANGVQHLGKPASVTVKIDFALLGNKNLTQPVMTAEAEITTKLPKPDANKALFFFDEEGNPTTKQQRQPDLGLTIAGSTINHQQGAA